MEKQTSKKQYQYSNVDMPIVAANIDEYIIPELQAACKYLWSINVFTFMCSNRENINHVYIILDQLSNENEELFLELSSKYPENFFYNVFRSSNTISIPDTTGMTAEEISEEILRLAKLLLPQDIPSKFYMTSEEYLISCGCYDEVENPNYTSSDINSFDINIENFTQLFSVFGQESQDITIKVFNEDKMEKSFKEYVIENGDEDRTDFETGIVYNHPYYLQKHKNFTLNIKR